MEKITALIDKIYADAFPQAMRERLLATIVEARDTTKLPRKAHWDEQDVVLITYADQHLFTFLPAAFARHVSAGAPPAVLSLFV